MTAKNIIIQILWLPWTLWCALVFVAALLIAFPVFIVVIISRNEKWIHDLHYLPPLMAKIVLFLWGVKVEIKNKELIEPQRQLIYISNHRSYLDGIIASAVIPNFLKFLGKAEILSWPLLGYMVKHLYVFVWRTDKEHRAWSMEQMKEQLKSGASFYICPEGTCNTTSAPLLPFHTGAHRLAIENKLPMVPLTFIGAGKLFPRNGLMIRPGKIIVYWHPAIETAGLNLNDTEKLKEETMEIIRRDL